MNALTEFQTILGKDGKPAFVVVPFEEFEKLKAQRYVHSVPHAVVTLAFENNMTPMAAWREHLRLTQIEVANRMKITQAAYAQMERVKKPRKATLEKVANALGLTPDQLCW
ncbi:MAG: helix-turn-helix domain-containing protein [Burkholderiaceae bacterium]|nr:helix-turn-helix domain-containing protein [Burkholderiaceae bacterium]